MPTGQFLFLLSFVLLSRSEHVNLDPFWQQKHKAQKTRPGDRRGVANARPGLGFKHFQTTAKTDMC